MLSVGFFEQAKSIPDIPQRGKWPGFDNCVLFSRECVERRQETFEEFTDADYWLVHVSGKESVEAFFTRPGNAVPLQFLEDEAVRRLVEAVLRKRNWGLSVTESDMQEKSIKEVGDFLTHAVKSSKSLHAAFVVTTEKDARNPVVCHDAAGRLGLNDEQYQNYAARLLRLLLDAVALVDELGQKKQKERESGGLSDVILREIFFDLTHFAIAVYQITNRGQWVLVGLCDVTDSNSALFELEPECRKILEWMNGGT